MWLPMWVFDGNGFTMACLAVWIRNVALRWDLPQMTIRQERWMRRHPTAPVNVARISVATSGTDFTAPEAGFAALIRGAGFRPVGDYDLLLSSLALRILSMLLPWQLWLFDTPGQKFAPAVSH